MDAQRLRLFPLKTVLFPGAALNLHVFEARYRQMISECLAGGEAFGVVLIRDGDEADDPNVSPYDIGTTAQISEVTPLPSGRYYINTTGGRRFRIERVVSRDPFIVGEVAYLDDEAGERAAIDELNDEVRGEFREYMRLLVEFSGAPSEVSLPDDPVDASFLIGDALQVGDVMKQRLLELRSTRQRLAVELGFLRRLLPQLRRLLERKAARPKPAVPSDAMKSDFRSAQERFFGKHFSVN